MVIYSQKTSIYSTIKYMIRNINDIIIIIKEKINLSFNVNVKYYNYIWKI